ncbi:acyltransferase [Spongiactinospora sp. TRM90649]|uniref:acyltransferase family protein n=1 Tax=Spongiactinospora sp. TRM90649 TaxID=3031114 RepID=UPI0023F63A2B|nr:acyltransferase [Spongiactinospora sp. TRM90649]MDF5755023.1 acyltransferase [Spongiactinospora sp. TRM90649]
MADSHTGSPRTSADVPLPAPPRLPSLTGLRWFAAFVVFGFHVHHSGLTDDPVISGILGVLFEAGASGVPFFFVLSGMVLTWSARPGTRPSTFWRRRAARVLPNHVATWIGVLALLFVLGEVFRTGPAISGLFLVQAWFPDEAYYFGGNTPAWSLSCELAFYAAFPLLLPLVRRIPGKRLWAVAVAMFGGIWLVPLATLALPVDLGYWFVWIFPITRALEFALGMTIAVMVREGRWHGPGLLPSGLLVLAAYLTVPYVPDAWGWVAWMAGPYAVLIAAAAVADVRGSRSLLRAPVLVWLGEVSFAFYLVHQSVVRLVAWLAGDQPQAPLALAGIAAMLALAVAAAWALYRIVERPLERRLSGARVTG